jgi:GNAT superfamily N-acetyltransferase
MEYSPLESRRFGLKVLRGSADKLDAYGLLQTIVEQQADVAILRLPSTEQHTLHKLELMPFPVVVADTLVYYQCDMTVAPPKPLRNTDLEVRIAQPEDRQLLQSLIDEIFQDYSTHYYSNPVFDRQQILDGYKEWTLGYLEPGDSRVCFLFYRNGQAIAFVTCNLMAEHGEIVLGGVLPSAQGGGVYSDFIRYSMKYIAEHGLSKVLVSTQIQNYAVQKVWVREGYTLIKAYSTVHVNALLSQKMAQKGIGKLNIIPSEAA